MKKKKNIIMLVLLILVALMTGAYAAYTTNLNIGATTSQSGTYGVVLTGCTTEVVKIGTAGAQAPTATCSPSGASTEGAATCSANFMQPGDSVRCNFNVKNTGNLKAKADGNILCDSGNSAAGGFNVSSSSGNHVTIIQDSMGSNLTYGVADFSAGYSLTYNSGMTLTPVWNRNRLAAGETLTNEFSITLTAPDTSNWAIKPLGSVSCFINYVQDI